MSFFYSKDYYQHGCAKIKNTKFDYVLHDKYIDFVSTIDLSKSPRWKPVNRSDLKNTKIICRPKFDGKVVLEVIVNDITFLDRNTLRCYYSSLFVHEDKCSIDVLEFEGPTINQIVQNDVFRIRMENTQDVRKCDLQKEINLLGRKYDISTITNISTENKSGSGSLYYVSKVYFHFYSPLTSEEAIDFYQSFIMFLSFLSYKRNVYCECNTLRSKNANYNGQVYISSIDKKIVDFDTKPISLESVFPIIEDLLIFIIDKKSFTYFFTSKNRNLFFRLFYFGY